MKALHGMFTMQPSPASLPPDLNAQLINALYDYQPGESDSQAMQAWLAVMQEAHLNLFRYVCHTELYHMLLHGHHESQEH